MRADVTSDRRATRPLVVVWLSVLALLAACAGASAEPATTAPTASLLPTAMVTATIAPATALPTATVPPATASPSPQASATTAPSATPTILASATLAASATAAMPTPKPTASDFTPQQASVWDTEIVGTDNMQGTCSNPVTPVYGRVLITPEGNTLKWKNQEPAPYTMSRVRASIWQYSGPTSIGDGTVTMVVQFTSATSLLLTRTFVSSAEPNCTHVHHYTGTFQWNR